MIVGMIPMSLALEKGSQMQAPLGRAVVGGLLVSTFSTLLFVPAIFAVIMGSRKHVSPSLHPDDPNSPHAHLSSASSAEHAAGTGHGHPGIASAGEG
jgi:AcrB/AcrD/AcrF family